MSDVPTSIEVPAGTYVIGGDPIYPEEAERSVVELAAFDIDATEVTYADFAEFVSATGYVTRAERVQPGFDTPGGAVFSGPSVTNPTGWSFVEGASWRRPEGPDGAAPHPSEPVVQVALEDALAYADWRGRALPNEAEWEAVAQAQTLPRGEAVTRRANAWQGPFPVQDTGDDGYMGRAPVGCFAPNARGAYDMVGNVWEWTDTPVDASGTSHLIKGGSYLCADNFCRRDRPIARQFQEVELSTNHIGFRTIGRKPD